MEEVEVVVAHSERATLRVGDVFLKIDADQARVDVEVEAMAMAPIPTPEVLWRKPPVLALAALPGTALGRLGEPSIASAAAWAAAGAAVRMLHDAPLPPWPSRPLDESASHLDGECEWLVTNGVLPADLVTRNRRVAEAALRPWTPVFTHGDLQITHVFVDGDEITGVLPKVAGTSAHLAPSGLAPTTTSSPRRSTVPGRSSTTPAEVRLSPTAATAASATPTRSRRATTRSRRATGDEQRGIRRRAMNYLHFDVGQQHTGAVVETSLRGGESDVFLVDNLNFQKFKRGDNFKYVGGHFDRSPVTLQVPHNGDWTAVVIPTAGRVEAAVRVVA